MGAVIPPRWHYRFDNYRRALLLLREAMALERPIWQQALDARNKMSHTDNIEDFEQVIADVRLHYLDALGELYDFLSAQKLKEPLN
jgi:hypothetical protein